LKNHTICASQIMSA